MTKLWNKLKGWKTYIACAASIVYAITVIGWQQGDWVMAGEIILKALTFAGIRHAI